MANYNIVIGSKFRPFSYTEMLAPVAQSTEAHQKVEEGYANLSAQADMIAGLAAMEPDSEAARRYKAYSDSLYEKADRLARNGLTPQDRSDMLSMYSRYAKEIKPIETAIKMREADITRQDTLYDKGNGKIRFDREARDVSIDEYLDGKRPKYTSLNLDSIRQEVAANTQAWSKRYFSTEEGQRFNGEYYKLVQNQGVSPDKAQAILLGDLSQYPELQRLIASEKGMVNYSGFSKNTQAEVDNAITQGLNMGMFYDRKEANPENWGLKMERSFQNQVRLKELDAAIAAAANGQPDWQGVQGESIPVHFTEGGSEEMKKKMAEETYRVITAYANSGNKKAKELISKFKGKDDMVKYLATNGYDSGYKPGDKITDKNRDARTLYYAIGNSIRNNITGDEGMINIWRSPYDEAASIDDFNPILDEGKYNKLGANRERVRTTKGRSKSWGDFDERARQAFTVNAVGFKDDRTRLSKYLEKTLTQVAAGNDSYKMYDIKRIKSDNTYEYSNAPVKKGDLPKKTSNGKEVIDYDRIYRAQLSNGDFMLYWVDDKGNPVQKVVKRNDLPKEAAANWSNRSQGYDAIMQDYANKIIDYNTMQELLGRLGDTTLANDYYLTQGVDVKDQELK